MPSGTVTFLFTDIEGSTRRWEEQPGRMQEDLARHDEILRVAVDSHGGYVFATGGDGFAAAFARAGDALGAAQDAQLGLVGEQLPGVRMGVHTGEVQERDGDYFGSAVNRASRLMTIGHGGQILVSLATERLVSDFELRDLGEHRLRDLSTPERVFQLCAPGLRSEFPPLRSLDVLPMNLPVQLTSFIGRDDDVKRVRDLLSEHRSVTLTGVGGVGKTRLAQQVAADVLDDFAGGAWLVELAPVGDESHVVEAIASALSVQTPRGRTVEQALLDAVRPLVMLLVLDNCEHLLTETCRIAEVMLRAAPDLSVLATSREPLGLAGEHVMAVRSLDSESAVRLFVDRARSADSAFELSEGDATRVEQLCRRLDGMPLAIELAAARVRMFSPQELAERLDQRFRLLTGGRASVERHQTLRAAIDWSYELLSARDRTVFDRLSVFADGCDLTAAQAVCGVDGLDETDVVDALASLIDKSLLNAERTPTGTRYRELETVRQYGEEQLMAGGGADRTRERHARYFAAFARDAGRGLWSAEEISWAQRVEADLGNLRAAVSWAVAADETDVAMRIAGAFVNQAVERPSWATASIADHALRVSSADEHPWRAIVLGEASWAAARSGDQDRARALVDGALDAQRRGARFSAAVWSYAQMHGGYTDRDIAIAHNNEALARAEAAGDLMGAVALRASLASVLANVLGGGEKLQEARAHGEQALADARTLGQPALIAMGLLATGTALVLSGKHREGRTMVRESAQLAGEIGSVWQRATALSALAAADARQGNARDAATELRDALKLARATGDTYLAFQALYAGLEVFYSFDRPDLAAQSAGHASPYADRFGFAWHVWHDPTVERTRADLGDEQYELLSARGAATPSNQFIDEVIIQLDTFLERSPTEASTSSSVAARDAPPSPPGH
jgi:predicted ATPase